MKINKYFPFAFLYFFLNSFALPFGLTYTAILAPFFYIWILMGRKKEIILPFITVLAPFVIVHLFYDDISRKVYFYSLVNLVLVYIFCQAVYTFLKDCNDVERIFSKLLAFNTAFCLVAIVLYFTPWQYLLWYEQNLTEGVSNFRRLKLLTYEPSYYATLLVPIFCFYTLQYLFRQNQIRGRLLLPMIVLPFLLSFSFGVIAALFVSALLTYLLYFRSLTKRRRVFNSVVFAGSFSLMASSIIYYFFRNSFLMRRLINIVSGNDTSGNGRTSDAFVLARKMLATRNEFWGIGPGQIKIIGGTILRNYYLYSGEFVATIPNATAETLAIFGWVGLSMRIFIEIFLFFYTKVWTNYYRLWLYLFVFIYQFTGSFITNVAEYVIWIFAFTNVFRHFDVVKRESFSHAIPLLQPTVE